jgi:hypothetical protein
LDASRSRPDWYYRLGIRASAVIGIGLVLVAGVVALDLIDIGAWYVKLTAGALPAVGLAFQGWIRKGSDKIRAFLVALLKDTILKALLAAGAWASRFRIVRIVGGALLLAAVVALLVGAIVVNAWASAGVALIVAGVIGSVLWYRLGPDGPRDWKPGGKYGRP